MIRHQRSGHKVSAIMLLGLSVVVFYFMTSASMHTTSQQDVRNMVIVCAIASLIFALWWIFSWRAGRVSIRSVTIVRELEPDSYWLAMLGFLIFFLAFLVSLIHGCYVLFKHAA